MSDLVDMKNALNELGLDKADFIEFTQDLKVYLDETLPHLEQIVMSMDFKGIKEQSHAIKGAVANLRFIKAAEVAFFLETAGRNQSSDQVAEKFNELKDVLNASFLEIKQKHS